MPESRHSPRPWLCILALAALGAGLSLPAWAGLPFGGQHYPNGVVDFVGGALPPPGYYLINYMGLIQKDRLMDKDGDVLDHPAGGNTKFSADVFVEVPRFIWVSPFKLLGASYGAHVFFPTYRAVVESNIPPANGEDSGLGDIIFSPFFLGWHFGPNLHAVFAVDIWAPTGDYEREDPATQILSKNHWTFEPVLAVTYLWRGFDASIKLMYDFNTTNDDYNLAFVGGSGAGDFQAGQELHFDWGLSYAHTEGLRYGLSGYYFQQMTDDELEGREVDDSKSRIASIGPTIKYWPNKGRWSFTVKHLWEFAGENIPEGQNTWLNAVYAF